MNHKPLLAALFSALLVFSPLAVKADDVVNALPLDTETTSSTQPAVMLTPHPTSTEPTASALPDPESIPVSPAPSSTVVCLAIVEPNPLEGPEWIALYGLTPSTTDALLDWSLFDAQGSLLKFSTSTLLLWDEGTSSVRTELKSSRLNNGGDTVILKTPGGQEHDQLVYTNTLKGERWFRSDCTSPWRSLPERVPPADQTPVTVTSPSSTETTAPPAIVTPSSPVETAVPPADVSPTSTTSIVADVPTDAVDPVMMVSTADISPLPEAEAEPEAAATTNTTSAGAEEAVVQTGLVIQSPPPSIIAPPATPAPMPKTAPAKAVPATSPSKIAAPIKTVAASTKKAAIAKVEAAKEKTPAKTATSTKKTVAPKTATKKASTASTKKEPIFTPLTMSALLTAPEPFQGVRVRIMGRVASQKGVIAANRYVLINADGRGLIVHATTKLPSPPQGAIIEVTGTITLNDEGLWLKQSTTDQWLAQTMTDEEKKAAIPTRNVNLVAPAQEDAWSNLTIEGKVTAVQKTSFDLDLDSGTIRVRISSKLGYRTQRLQVGDTVAVQGLLDLRAEDPLIVPQTIEAIQIIKRANLAGTTTGASTKAPVSYPWLPVGAAASTLGLSEGFRRLRDRQKRRREEASFQALVQHHAQQERRELE